MLAGGAAEGAGVGAGECSATRDMLAVVLGALGGCYWRMEVVWVMVLVVLKESVSSVRKGELSQGGGRANEIRRRDGNGG